MYPKLVLIAGLAMAATPASAHDWYQGLKSPGGDRCCLGGDCPPVEERYNPLTHHTEVGIEGQWVPVDPAKLVNVPSPDGAAHACYERYWMLQKMTPIVRCIILPGDA